MHFPEPSCAVGGEGAGLSMRPVHWLALVSSWGNSRGNFRNVHLGPSNKAGEAEGSMTTVWELRSAVIPMNGCNSVLHRGFWPHTRWWWNDLASGQTTWLSFSVWNADILAWKSSCGIFWDFSAQIHKLIYCKAGLTTPYCTQRIIVFLGFLFQYVNEYVMF